MSARRYRKANPSAVFLLILVIAALILLGFFALQKPTPVLADSLRFPLGEELVLSEVITDVKNGSLTEPDRKLEAQKEGSVKVLFTMKNLLQVEHKGEILIEFYDSKGDEPDETKEEKPAPAKAPTITSPERLYTYKGEEPDLKTDISATDHHGADLAVSLEGEYDVNTPGDYTLTLKAESAEGGVAEQSLTLTVLDTPFGEKGALKDGKYLTKNGKSLEVKGGIAYAEGILIANKSYSLPKTYTSSYLMPEAEKAYYAMRDAAKSAGHTLKIKSAYRSWNDQNYIFNGYVKNDSLENALTYSARPGHSEHQTGLGMDLITSSSEAAQNPEIKVILDWLSEHAHEYGFILRYPEGKSDITGYIFEPWHYRYVGKDLATILHNGGDWITLEEYYGIDSVYRGY